MNLIFKILLSLVAGYGVLCASLYFLQSKLLFHPYHLNADYSFEFEHDFEEVLLEPEAGVRISAVLFSDPRNKRVVFFHNGNGGRLLGIESYARNYLEQGFDFLGYDYRQYGKSTGPLTQEGLLSDSEHLFGWLLERYEEESILVEGMSLGSGIATSLASKFKPAGLILISPYYSLQEVAGMHYPYVPVSWLLQYPIPTAEYIQKVSAPILIVHGTNDSIIPYASGVRLKEYLDEKDIFVTVTGGAHEDFTTTPEYQEEKAVFLNRIFRKKDKENLQESRD
jgi:hypothetical protein